MGEQPCLWSTLDLDTGPVLWTQDLMLQLLSISRLQTLKQLTLDFFQYISWQDYKHLLQIIIENSPSVLKLSLEPTHLGHFEPRPHIDHLSEELVAKVVKFEEVDFGKDGFFYHRRNATVATAILRRITKVASSEEESKLRVLSMGGFEPSSRSTLEASLAEALAEARKILTVNFLGITPRRILVDF